MTKQEVIDQYFSQTPSLLGKYRYCTIEGLGDIYRVDANANLQKKIWLSSYTQYWDTETWKEFHTDLQNKLKEIKQIELDNKVEALDWNSLKVKSDTESKKVIFECNMCKPWSEKENCVLTLYQMPEILPEHCPFDSECKPVWEQVK